MISTVNQREKISRVEWKTALKSIYSEMTNYQHFDEKLWSDGDVYNCRNQKATLFQQGKYQFNNTVVKVIANHGHVSTDLKHIYQSVTEEEALLALDQFGGMFKSLVMFPEFRKNCGKFRHTLKVRAW